MMLAQQNVATVCGRSLQEVRAISEQLQTPLEVPVMNNDSVSTYIIEGERGREREEGGGRGREGE